MTQSKSIDAQRQLDGARDAAGLLHRYARGRLSHFWARQILTALGGLALAAFVSVPVGLCAIGVAALGEVIDCAMLKWVLRCLDQDAPLQRLSRFATLSAGIQAASISACVMLAWLAPPANSGTFFAMAFLLSAALNAGIVWPFHPPSSMARLGVYGASVVIGAGVHWWLKSGDPHQHLFEITSICLMCYVVYIFLKYVIESHSRHIRGLTQVLDAVTAAETSRLDMRQSRDEARKLALVAQHANDSVIITGRDRKIAWVNDTFSRISGYSAKEAIGQTPTELLNGPETSEKTVAQIAEQLGRGDAFRSEILNYRKTGEKIWMETNLVPVKSDSGEIEMVIAIERDITAIKQHEAELAEAKVAAERGEQAKSEFLATMSHEIRTPMNGIIGLSDLLREMDLEGDAGKYVATISDSANALLTILNDILDYSKLDAGQISINPAEFDLRDCINNAVQLFASQAVEKGIFVDLIEEQSLPKTVVGDDGRLRQILVNLIGNAIKFTAHGGITIRTNVVQKTDVLKLSVAISDTGIGIPADRLSHIFERFSQADGKTTREYGGTGLGLAISRLLARRMGGDIDVKSAPDDGATFTLRVELGVAPSVCKRLETTVPVRSPDFSGLSVLVAEDNKTNRFLILKYLQDQGLELRFAQDGSEAVEQTEIDRPDVIFMDMSMPKMDGLEATRRIRKLQAPQPHIIALTANAFASDRAACLAAGMDDFLAKPVRKAELLGKLAQLGTATETNAL